jgi:CubicO group peptidase (beta-lactamase class C family)
MKKTAKGILIASLLVVLSASLTLAQDNDSRIAARVVEELKVRIPEWIKESAMPGAAVAIVDDTSILWQTVFGQTSREGGLPITPETLFSIQSMSKSFTALGVLMAVQHGVLDLDTPIIKYIPDFTVNSPFEDHPERKMTLRLLLSHRAGFTHEAPLGGNYDDRPHSFNEHVLSISDTWLRYPVGYRFSYSNLGIDLAGYILQEMVGIPFWDYIQQKVVDPLGMKQSTMDIDKIIQSKNRAIGHVSPQARIDGGIPVFIPMIPAGGVYTNILDMAKYMQFHINKGQVDGRQLLESKLLDQMHAVSFPEDHQRAGYGLCLNRGLVSRTYYLQHGGGGYGFATSMVMYPEIKLGVVTMCNSRDPRVNGGRIMEVINRIIEEELGNTEPHPAQPTVDTAQPVSLTDKRIERLKGMYDQNIVIGHKDEEFGITLGRDFYPLKFYLDHEGELVGVFGNYSELRVKPPLWGHNGSLVHLNRYSGSCRYYDFHRPEKSKDRPGPDKPEWKRYLGRYRMLAWGRMQSSLLSIRVKDGYLSCNNMRCTEFEPGLFFTFNGEALDFRGTIPTFRNIMLIKSVD